MREIEFRGKIKSTDNEIWVYGSLLKDIHQNKYYIVDNENGIGKEVREKTVGQYIGKLDSKANKLFEKDIVKGIRKTNKYEEYEYFEVKFHNGCFMTGNFNMHEFFDKFSHKEVIGNTIDNPELLEKENTDVK